MKILKVPGFQFAFFLLILFVINLLQINFTSLFEDEAYYYIWSKNLAFGYFDHPPMVALWAAAGQVFADRELGLRLISPFAFCLMIYIIWKTIDVKDKWQHVFLFFLIIISLAFWQAFGFIITPDTPLLLFTALFLFAYKRFLEKETPGNILLLGFSMSAMLYSKYHGILVLGFVVLSHLNLLKNKRFWMASVLGLLFFLPHLIWQYQNHFPSFEYHLKERGKKPYSIMNNVSHLLNMIAVVGLTFPVIYKAFFRLSSKNTFERSLKFIVYGFFVFFFLASFASRPQAQWVIVILIPISILVFPYFIEHPKPRKWLMILGGTQFIIILIIRVFLAVPELSPVVLEPHIAQQWVPELKNNTQEKPVVFVNSYRNASLYNFYTGIKTHSYSILRGRKSQYDLLDFESKMQGEDVYSATFYNERLPVLAVKIDRPIYGAFIPNYHTFEKVKCIIEKESLTFVPGANEIEFRFMNTYDKNITFEKVRFVGVFQGFKNKILLKVPLTITGPKIVMAGEQEVLKAQFNLDELPSAETMTFRVALEFYELKEGFQGNKVTVVKTNE